MIKVLALLLIIVSVHSYAAEQSQDRWLAQDKSLHISLSSALVSTFYHLHQYKYGSSKISSEVFAAQVTIFIGIAKEIGDPKFSYKDLIADLLGITVGLLLIR